MDHALDLAIRGLPSAAWLCAICVFPFAIHALLSKRVAILGKLCAGGAYAGLAYLAGQGEREPFAAPIGHAVAFGYVTLCALGVWAAGSRTGRSTGTRDVGLFLGLCALLVLLPGAVLPAPASFFAVAWGFELVFKAYSYLLDGRIQGARPSMEDALFFLLIDPVLCFPERGRRVDVAGFRLPGVLRIALGIGALFAHTVAIALLLSMTGLGAATTSLSTELHTASLVATYYVGRFFAGYARHSGGASLAIGAMRLLGYEVGERYRYPWLATSPADFWRRWNIYLGSWARRYLFIRLAGHLQRRSRTMPWGNAMAKSVAVLATFSLIGVLHDLGMYAQYDRWPIGGLLVFGLNGVALLAWIAAERGLSAALDRLRVPARRAFTSAGPALSRTLFLPFLAATLWVAIPTMSTDFALGIDDLLRAVGAIEGGRP